MRTIQHRDTGTELIAPHIEKTRTFGGHLYYLEKIGGASNCKRCDCLMGKNRQAGPAGIDPFGVCPGNPLCDEGKINNYKSNMDFIICARIGMAESLITHLEKKIDKLSHYKNELVRKLEATTQEINKIKGAL